MGKKQNGSIVSIWIWSTVYGCKYSK